MTPRNTNERIAPEHQLSAHGQVALRLNGRGPKAPQPNREYPVFLPSPSERDIAREFEGHQISLLPNVLVEALREQHDKRFFDQPAPLMVELDEPAELFELPLPTATDRIVEFPQSPLVPAA